MSASALFDRTLAIVSMESIRPGFSSWRAAACWLRVAVRAVVLGFLPWHAGGQACRDMSRRSLPCPRSCCIASAPRLGRFGFIQRRPQRSCFSLFGFVLYVLGRAYDLRIALVSFVVILAGVLLSFRGTAGLRAGWFALLFPLFALPLPFELVLAVTGPMKIAVWTIEVAAQLLSWAGYPAGNSGVVMTIGQYQLLVTEACAGLQTMFTLEAMGLLYVSLVGRGSPRHNGILAVLIVPIAFGANVIRVIVLALVTYYYGDAAGQGFLHGFSGIVLFATALAMVIVADDLLGRVRANGWRT